MLEGINGTCLIAGVLDGVSGLYLPSEGPELFNGKSGGQVVCEIVNQIVATAKPEENLEDILFRANAEMRFHFFMRKGVSLERSDLLPGAAFAIAKINRESIEIIQGADCIAVWQRRNGRVSFTKNQVFPHELEWRQLIENLLQKYQGDRNKVWEELIPVLSRGRLQRVNQKGGYALLNGQLHIEECWQRVILLRQEVKTVLLFSDGLIPFSESGKKNLGKQIMESFRQKGLQGILAKTREVEEIEKEKSHIDHAEASAIAIEL